MVFIQSIQVFVIALPPIEIIDKSRWSLHLRAAVDQLHLCQAWMTHIGVACRFSKLAIQHIDMTRDMSNLK